MNRIGIYAGTFDPIHAGHIGFALTAADKADLDHVFLLPENHPRFKPHASALEQRVVRINEAIKTHAALETLLLPDASFTVSMTLPELQLRFGQAQIAMLVGADVLEHMPSWPGIYQLMETCELIIGIRDGYDTDKIHRLLDHLPCLPLNHYVVRTPFGHLASRDIRKPS